LELEHAAGPVRALCFTGAPVPEGLCDGPRPPAPAAGPGPRVMAPGLSCPGPRSRGRPARARARADAVRQPGEAAPVRELPAPAARWYGV
jgi:hypothetical protein